MEHNSKEQWVDEVMNSTAGMRKAQPAAYLFGKILIKLDNVQNAKVLSIPVKQWAAAAILLLALNIGSVIHFTSRKSDAGKINPANPLAPEMQLETTYNY